MVYGRAAPHAEGGAQGRPMSALSWRCVWPEVTRRVHKQAFSPMSPSTKQAISDMATQSVTTSQPMPPAFRVTRLITSQMTSLGTENKATCKTTAHPRQAKKVYWHEVSCASKDENEAANACTVARGTGPAPARPAQLGAAASAPFWPCVIASSTAPCDRPGASSRSRGRGSRSPPRASPRRPRCMPRVHGPAQLQPGRHRSGPPPSCLFGRV